MKCIDCDAILSDFEATRRRHSTGAFLELCDSCFAPVAHMVDVIEREDLAKQPYSEPVPEDFSE